MAVSSLCRGENNWTTLADSLAALHCAGVQVDWSEFHRPFEKALHLPTYAWNDKTYWIQYNGNWALTKGNTYYDDGQSPSKTLPAPSVPKSSLSTSTVHQVIEQTFDGPAGTVIMQSDLMQADFYSAAWGHKMNGCGVVTSVSPLNSRSRPTSRILLASISTRNSSPDSRQSA